MTAFPFTRSKPNHANLEAGVRSLVADIQASHDRDTAAVLAGAINIYQSSMIRFRGNTTWGPEDMEALFSIWLTLLDVRKAKPGFTGEKREVVERLQPETPE